jgi:hypothetical protein
MNYECFEDKEVEGAWRVEGFNKETGEVTITLFVGPRAPERARQYFVFISEAK